MIGRTTGARIASVLAGYAALVVLASLAALVVARPLAEAQLRAEIVREQARLAPQAGESAAALAARIAARRAPVVGGELEYSLRAASGAVLAGSLGPALKWQDRGDGYGRFEQAPPQRGAAPRRLYGRTLRYPDGAVLLLAADVDARVAAGLRLLGPVTLAALLSALVGIAAALWSARLGGQQVRDASAVVGRILAGDLSQRLPNRPGTGFSIVAREFNVALERLEHLTVAMRTVADSTAHDLRAPLNRLRATLEYALVGEAGAVPLRSAVERALGELERVEITLEALLRIALAEAGAASFAPVDVAALVADVVDLYRPLAEQKGQQLDCVAEPGLLVNGNAQLLAQAVANLLDNAIKYTPRDGRIEVRAGHERDGVALSVADTGPGIAPEDRARALERSRRLANAAGSPGSGLGLALVAAVMRLHGATIELDDGRPGLRVRLWMRAG